MPRIGLLGGSFDPIHLGHIAMAEAAAKELNFDQIRFIPTRQNPLKSQKPGASAQERLEMLKLALQGYENFVIDTRELDRKDDAAIYTIDTVRALKREMGSQNQLYWIMGSDNLRGMHEWNEIAALVDLLDGFVIFRRVGGLDSVPEDLAKMLSNEGLEKIEVGFLSKKLPDISASQIREKIRKSEEAKEFLPPLVYEFIRISNAYKKPLIAA